MAHTTLTLTGTAYIPSGLSGTPSASTDVLINSGVTAFVESGFTCNLLSCLGNAQIVTGGVVVDGKPGLLSPVRTGQRVKIVTKAASQQVFLTVAKPERTTGSTIVATGGGTS